MNTKHTTRTEPFTEKVRQFRLSRGLTYKELGVLLGVSEGTARRVCLGVKPTERIEYKISTKLSDFGNGAAA